MALFFAGCRGLAPHAPVESGNCASGLTVARGCPGHARYPDSLRAASRHRTGRLMKSEEWSIYSSRNPGRPGGWIFAMEKTGTRTIHLREQLGITLGIALRVQLRGSKDTWNASLVGMVEGRYLIAEVPPIPGLWVKLHQMNNIIVRYLHDGKAYGFYSTLIAALNEPFRLAFLSYPEKIETVNLRKFQRVPCLIPGAVSMSGVSRRGVFTDVSEGGCSFLLDQSGSAPDLGVNIGDEIVFSVRLIGSSDERSVKAIVRNIRTAEKGTSIGTQFHEPGDDLLDSIRTYMGKVGNLDVP